MIGRFAATLGGRLPGQLIAGAILTLVGLWFVLEPLRHDYPAPDDLVAVEDGVVEAMEIRKRRGAVVRFLVPDPFELRAVLEADRRIVHYRSDLPHYQEFREALTSGTHVFHLWDDAPEADDATLVWQLDSGEVTLISVDDTIEALSDIRQREAWLPGAIALFGLAIIALTLWHRA